jgi:acetyltransferase
MGINGLERVFHPTSIAVVGASDQRATIGYAVMYNLTAAGFEGPIYPVNPRRSEIMGLRVVRSLTEIDGPVDLLVVATPIDTVVQIINESGHLNAAGAVIISAGGKETGAAGRQREARIQSAAREVGLRLIGPNCLGITCRTAHLNASFAARMPLEGNLAFISQSGAICTAILDYSAKEGIGFSHFISLGSMLDVDVGDLIDYLGTDPKVGSILMYVESLTQLRKFMSAARGVSRVKPIIVLKAGRTAAGSRAAASHTGAMAGEDTVYEAAFERAGVVRVRTFEELFDTAEMLSRKGRYQGPGLAIVTNAGGPGVMAVDALSDYGLSPVSLTPATLNALDAVLPPHWSRANPVDILGDASPERYATAVEILYRSAEVQALLIMLAPQAMTDAGAVARVLAERCHDQQKPVFCTWLGGLDVETGRTILNQAGLATFDTPERAVRAFRNLHRHARSVEMLKQIPPRLSTRVQVDRDTAGRLIETGLSAGSGRLGSVDAKALLSAYGIPVNPTLAADSADAARRAADALGYPVVMKIRSPDISHKSDVGGVRLGLNTPLAVTEGFRQLLDTVSRAATQARIEGVTLEPMVAPAAYELILGARLDHDFGPVILFGMGGVLTELLRDVAFALPPLNRLLASRLMAATRICRLLGGYRHLPPVDRERIEELLIRLSQLVSDFPQIGELDINPLVIGDDGPIALDARVSLAPASTPAPMHLVVSPYPAQYESHARIAEVGDLLIRPIRPEDAPLLALLFDTLSPQSVYYRFFSPMKALSPDMLARFTQIDYDREIAMVAISEAAPQEKMLGAARIILAPNQKDAEFAVLVGDPWQGKGIGAHLLSTCLKIAKERNFGTIWGTVLAENKGMLALGRRLGFTAKRTESVGEFELCIDLPQLPKDLFLSCIQRSQPVTATKSDSA